MTESVYGFVTKFKRNRNFIERFMKSVDGILSFDIMMFDNHQLVTAIFEDDAAAMRFRFEYSDFISSVSGDVEEPVVKCDNEVYLFAAMCDFKNQIERDAFDAELTPENGVVWWTYEYNLSLYQIQFNELDDAMMFKLKHGDTMKAFHQ